jgi:hypothetical protein
MDVGAKSEFMAHVFVALSMCNTRCCVNDATRKDCSFAPLKTFKGRPVAFVLLFAQNALL